MTKRPYRLFPAPLASGLQSPMQQVLQKRGFDQPALLCYWADAVGEALAPHSQPLKITGGRTKQGGSTVLTVRIHPAYATIFAYEAEAVLQRLTTLLGYRPADRISIIQ